MKDALVGKHSVGVHVLTCSYLKCLAVLVVKYGLLPLLVLMTSPLTLLQAGLAGEDAELQPRWEDAGLGLGGPLH